MTRRTRSQWAESRAARASALWAAIHSGLPVAMALALSEWSVSTSVEKRSSLSSSRVAWYFLIAAGWAPGLCTRIQRETVGSGTPSFLAILPTVYCLDRYKSTAWTRNCGSWFFCPRAMVSASGVRDRPAPQLLSIGKGVCVSPTGAGGFLAHSSATFFCHWSHSACSSRMSRSFSPITSSRCSMRLAMTTVVRGNSTRRRRHGDCVRKIHGSSLPGKR